MHVESDYLFSSNKTSLTKNKFINPSWQLAAEKEATLRLKGENGIMRKKFSALQKDIEDQREEIKGLLEKQQQLYENTDNKKGCVIQLLLHCNNW